jgi:hypothetical protein
MNAAARRNLRKAIIRASDWMGSQALVPGVSRDQMRAGIRMTTKRLEFFNMWFIVFTRQFLQEEVW